jgi:uncharacterized membrane protein
MFFRPIQSNESIEVVTKQLLRLLHVQVTNTTLKETLQEHPDYPSLLSISDSLRTWKVESVGVKVPFEQLISLPTPFLVHFKNNKIVPVIATHQEGISFLNPAGKERNLHKEEFLKQWDNVALLAEALQAPLPSPQKGDDWAVGEPDYKKKRREEILQNIRIPGALLITLILTVLTGITAIHRIGLRGIFSFLLSIVMLTGVIVSGLLLWYEIDKHNPVLQKICTGGKHTNCAAILQSGAAKVWGILSWSEIGFAYFTGGHLSLLLSGFNPAITEVTAWLNLLAVPYIFFSVFYQWKIEKQWCVLCLTVQALLLSGFIICLAGKYYTTLPHDISVSGITLLIMVYFLPLVAWKEIKPLWLKAREGKHYKTQLLRLKHDKRIFEALLPKQKSISEKEIQTLGIALGTPAATRKLVKVCNPYCGPCARAHPEIEKILESNPDVSAQIIFTAKDDEKDIKSKPVKHLMAIDEKGDKEMTKQALDDWYNSKVKDYPAFAEKYPMNGELLRQGEKLKAMSEWCEKTGISFTPTFFVFTPPPLEGDGGRQGHQLPDIYGVEDLKYLLG